MSKLYLGADVGGTKIAFLLRNEKNHTICTKTVAAANTVDSLDAAIHTFLFSSHVGLEQITAMGIGLPGCVDTTGQFVFDIPAYGWKDVNLHEVLFSHYPFPALGANDVNVALIGEQAEGEAQGLRDAVFIAIGTGLGGAVLTNGQIVAGHKGLAGEIGYLVEESDARSHKRFTSDAFGSLESKCSGSGLNQLGKPFGLSAKTLFAEASAGNSYAQILLEEFLNRIAVTAANCASLLNPEKIIFGGGLSTELPPFMEMLQEKVSALTPISVALCLSALGRDAGAIGACHLAIKAEQMANNS